MANLINTATGGVSSVAVTGANSGGLSGNPWDVLDVGATFEFSTVAMHGSLGYHVLSGTGVKALFGWQASLPNSKMQSYRAYVRMPSYPSAEMQIVTPRNSAGFIASVNLTTTGKIKISQRGSTTLFTSTGSMSLNTWYRIELSVEVGTTTSNGVVRFAYYLGDSVTPVETLFTSSTADLGTTDVVNWQMGKTANTPTWEAYWDSIEVDPTSSALLGPHVAPLLSVRPSSVVSNPGTWSNVGGAPTLEAAVADESNTTYLQSPPAPVAAAITFGPNGTLSSGTPTVKVRLACDVASPATYADVALMMGTTLIATRTFGPLSTTPTNYQFSPSAEETALITARNDLRVRVTANQP